MEQHMNGHKPQRPPCGPLPCNGQRYPCWRPWPTAEHGRTAVSKTPRHLVTYQPVWRAGTATKSPPRSNPNGAQLTM
eukprot:11155489-Lingulodinium_polyedra.AAC.1